MEILIKGQHAVDLAMRALESGNALEVLGNCFKVTGVSVHHTAPQVFAPGDPKGRGYGGPVPRATVFLSYFS